MAILVEHLDAAGQCLAIERFDDDSLVVGRGFDCDVCIPDPHVDPRHCRVVLQGEAGFEVTDLGTVNGTSLGGRRRRLHNDSDSLRSGGRLLLGKTPLRISDPAAPLQPALQLTRLDGFFDWAGSNGVNVAVMLLLALITALMSFLYSSAEFKPSDLIDSVVTAGAVVALVAGFWSLIGRFSKHKANIRAHLTIASAFLVLEETWTLLLDWLLYNVDSSASGMLLYSLSIGCIVIVGQYLHLRLATNLGPVVRLLIVAGILLLEPGLGLYRQWESRDQVHLWAPTGASLYPPAWRWTSVAEPQRLVDASAATFRSADAEAEALAEARQVPESQP